MGKLTCVLFLGVSTLFLCEAAAAAETCTSYLTSQREKMLQAALACEGTAGEMQSARPQVEAERDGQKLMTFAECSRPVSVAGDKDPFSECVRTHLCAAQTYSCAIAHSNARSSVRECGQATTACKITDPIPQ
jgi:hypothetical protein